MSKRRNKTHLLFPLQQDGTFEPLERNTSDELFNDAFGGYAASAQEPNRSFVGNVIESKRFVLASLIVAGIFFVFVGRTSALQLWQGAELRALAENNRMRERILPAQRGIIYDRDGDVLASNEPTFQVITARELLPQDPAEQFARLTALAQFFDAEAAAFQTLLNEAEARDESVLLLTNVSYEKAMQFAARADAFPEFDIEVGSRRTYITDEIPSLSHVLGYTGVVNATEFEALRSSGYRRFDHTGKQGVEAFYESYLRGTFGYEILEVDALGNTERVVSKVDPVDGQNLHLTIDADLQRYIEDVLTERLEGTAASKASVILMDPESGGILALVSWPAFDANLFTAGIDQETYQALVQDERLPLFPRAFAGEFPSGSTIKPTFAAAALMEGIITDQTAFLSSGGLRVGIWFFPDWRAGGHGMTNVYHAIADSVNTFFYIIGGGYQEFEGLGLERLMEYAALFGFGRPTGLDVPGEASGFLPSKEWKLETKGEPWYIGDTYHVAIGQGDFLATPLQIAQSTAVIANGGWLVTPHVAQQADIERTKIVPDDVAEIVRNAMRETVVYGSARTLASLPVEAAGKTGTAQWSSTKPNHAWFTGFAPFVDPEVVITVLVEEGDEDYLAVPIAKDILNWWFAE